jgi:hypothetical protein
MVRKRRIEGKTKEEKKNSVGSEAFRDSGTMNPEGEKCQRRRDAGGGSVKGALRRSPVVGKSRTTLCCVQISPPTTFFHLSHHPAKIMLSWENKRCLAALEFA